MNTSATIAKFGREARGQRLEVTSGNVFSLASCPSPLAWLLCDFATNRHESFGLALGDHHSIILAFFFQEHLDLFFP
jgi:hypothetical protein